MARAIPPVTDSSLESTWLRFALASVLSLSVAITLCFEVHDPWPLGLFAASTALAAIALAWRTPFLILLIPATYFFMDEQFHFWSLAFALAEVVKDIAVLRE